MKYYFSIIFLIYTILVNNEGELLREAFQWSLKNTYCSAEITRKLNLFYMKTDTLIYTKFNKKYKAEIVQLEEKLTNPNLTSSNHEKYIKNGVKTAKNISKIWNSGYLNSK